jgi:hypothetical protein
MSSSVLACGAARRIWSFSPTVASVPPLPFHRARNAATAQRAAYFRPRRGCFLPLHELQSGVVETAQARVRLTGGAAADRYSLTRR